MLFTCQKLLNQRIFPKSHNSVDIARWHMADGILEIVLHLPNMRFITVGIIHHKHRSGLAAFVIEPYFGQRKENTQYQDTPHCQIKSAAIAHLAHIDHPFHCQQHEHQYQKKFSERPLYLLDAMPACAAGGCRLLPAV